MLIWLYLVCGVLAMIPQEIDLNDDYRQKMAEIDHKLAAVARLR